MSLPKGGARTRQPDASATDFRESIARDLSWLFNSNALQSAVDLIGFEHILSSTLNYGIRSHSGDEVDGLNADGLRREIAVALNRFEPRLMPESLEIELLPDGPEGEFHFRIEAELCRPYSPSRLVLRARHGRLGGGVTVIDVTRER
ncbi:type VI secretion system baseplate subunit TssE [Ensifer adhaerens]